MVANTKPQQRKKEESEKLREERDQMKFIDLRFERWPVATSLRSCRNFSADHWCNASCMLRRCSTLRKARRCRMMKA